MSPTQAHSSEAAGDAAVPVEADGRSGPRWVWSTYLDPEQSTQERQRLPRGDAMIVRRSNPARSSGNEDAALCIAGSDRRAVLAVADGVGGNRGGQQASRLAIETLEDAIRPALLDEQSLRPAIVNAIEQANERILGLGMGAATTLAIAEIEGDQVRGYHVGDSALMLVGQRGRLKWQTIDHSPVGYAMEAGIIDQDEALLHDERHIVFNVVGSREMRIEIGPTLSLAARDSLLLATDGLFDNLNTSEIIEHIRKGPLEKCATAIMALVEQRMNDPREGRPGKPDDFTMIAYRRRHV